MDPRTLRRQNRLRTLRATLFARPLTLGERAELEQLEANEAQFIKRFARQLDRARARLSGLERIAHEIGIRHP